MLRWSVRALVPQAYAYASGNPLKYVDPTGQSVILVGASQEYQRALRTIVSTARNLKDTKCGRKHCGLDEGNLAKVYEAFAGNRTVVVTAADTAANGVWVGCGYTLPGLDGRPTAHSWVPPNPGAGMTPPANSGRPGLGTAPVPPGGCGSHAQILFHEVVHAATGLGHGDPGMPDDPESIHPCIDGAGRCER